MKKGFRLIEAIAVSLVFLLSSAPRNSFGSGFAIFTHDAKATGLAGSVVAHSSSPSSIFYNPALINRLEGTQVELGTTLLLPTREFSSDASGLVFKTKSELFYPSAFYVTHKINDSVSIGMGVFNSFGLATRWNDHWEGRYLATNSELTVFNFNPVISLKPTRHLSFAVGADVLKMDTTVEKKINLGIFPDANQKFTGNGHGIGYNLGALWEVTKNVSVGASYRSRIKTDIDGELKHALPSGSEPYIGSLFPDTRAKSEIRFPSQFQLGIALNMTSHFTLETGFRFEEWSTYKEQKITLSQPVAGVTTSVSEKNWKDTFSYNTGLDFRINDSFSLFGGYLFSRNPIPDKTFDPAIPDSDTNVISVGAELRRRIVNIGLSYGYQLLEERRKMNSLDDNPLDGTVNPLTSANGRYNSNLHMVGISLTFKF